MTRWKTAAFASILLLGSVAMAETLTPPREPSEPSAAQLEVRAGMEFNRGSYNAALPDLKKLSEIYKNEPARLGPVQEKVRVCERALASIKANPATQPAPAASPTAESRKPHPAPKAGEMLEMSIKELGNFQYDQEHGGNIPADVRRLSGAKIRLRGFMIPMDQAENITQFALVPSLFSCCIGGPPEIQHTIVVQCPKGKAVGYCPDEILVEGTLTVAEKKDDGYIVSVFGLDVSSVKPAPK